MVNIFSFAPRHFIFGTLRRSNNYIFFELRQENFLSGNGSVLQRRVNAFLVTRAGVRVSVCVCVCVYVSVHIFKHEYLCNQQADRNQILFEASLW